MLSDVHGPARLDQARAQGNREPGLRPAPGLGPGLAQAQAMALKSHGLHMLVQQGNKK